MEITCFGQFLSLGRTLPSPGYWEQVPLAAHSHHPSLGIALEPLRGHLAPLGWVSLSLARLCLPPFLKGLSRKHTPINILPAILQCRAAFQEPQSKIVLAHLIVLQVVFLCFAGIAVVKMEGTALHQQKDCSSLYCTISFVNGGLEPNPRYLRGVPVSTS